MATDENRLPGMDFLGSPREIESLSPCCCDCCCSNYYNNDAAAACFLLFLPYDTKSSVIVTALFVLAIRNMIAKSLRWLIMADALSSYLILGNQRWWHAKKTGVKFIGQVASNDRPSWDQNAGQRP